MIGDLNGFRAYASERGDSAPSTADDAVATAALVRASDHMRFHYVQRFGAGYDETSPNVEPATYELARIELATPNLFSRTYTPGERRVMTEFDGIKWQVLDDGKNTAVPVATRVDDMLRDYLGHPIAAFVV